MAGSHAFDSQGLVKQFFNEKEVTSTLVMDALYSGCKQVEEHSRMYMEVCQYVGNEFFVVYHDSGDKLCMAKGIAESLPRAPCRTY